MKKNNLSSGIFLCVLFAAALVMALGFPSKSKEFPIFLSVCGLALSLLLVILGIRDLKAPSGAEEDHKYASKKSRLNILVTFLSLVAYAVLIPRLGFCVSTFIYLVGSMIYLYPEKRTKKIYFLIGGVSVVFVAFLFVVFKIFLYVPLPTGLLI